MSFKAAFPRFLGRLRSLYNNPKLPNLVFDKHNATQGRRLQLLSIERVHNKVPKQRFQDKIQKYKQKFGHAKVVKLWHGTNKENVDSILENNFDPTRHGQNSGCRFGRGVCFSALASYASNYCGQIEDKIDGSTECMILTKVLISNVVEVKEKTSGKPLGKPPFLPGHGPRSRNPLRYDTTAKNKDLMDVIVKWDKDSYLPTHVVRFTRHDTDALLAATAASAAGASTRTWVLVSVLSLLCRCV